MNKTFTLPFIILLVFVIRPCRAAGEIDSLLHVLDKDVKNAAYFVRIKETRLNELKAQLAKTPPLSIERYELNNRLYDEYRAYSSDSAFHYLDENLRLAIGMQDKERELRIRLEQSYLLSVVGMYMEAKDILDGIERTTLPESLLGDYYRGYKHVYTEAGSAWLKYEMFTPHYQNLGKAYRDSILHLLPSDSETYLIEYECMLREKQRYEESLRVNDRRLAATKFGEPVYALVAYNRFQLLQRMNRQEEAQRYLILSAISDVRLAIKEQSSIMRLASILHEKGDLRRAYAYINYSWQVTHSYKTRMRYWGHIDPYSMISTSFQNTINLQNRKLQTYLVLITFLALLLGGSLLYIYRQMKQLKLAKKNLQEMNGRLSAMNDELEAVNSFLRSANLELSESNKIKEVYIARFFKLCSTYVDRLHAYRKLVNKKLQKKEVAELLKMTSPANDLLTTEVQELYANFDQAFLHLFPNFVKSLNELLQPEAQIVLKENELLNTELRILALIRLGITKSAQIAELLHYSPTTIYNYRTRLREKARTSRDDFEEQVAQIR